MNVLYDISVLGLGHMVSNARTGVFRVVENVARRLVRNPDCEIKFFSNVDRKTIEYSLAYLNSNTEFSNVPFSKPPFYNWSSSVTKRKESLIRQIHTNAPMSFLKRMQTKLTIKELIAIERLYKKYSDSLLNPADLKNADIYHSPFYAIPEDADQYNSRVFFTCYDLIPILFPNYFEDGMIAMMKKALHNITNKTWVLCISKSTRNDLLNYLGNKVDPEKVIVTELAASDTFYQSRDKEKNLQIRRKHNIPDSPYILSLCTFEPRKNLDQVIKSFARIIAQENIRDLHLVLVGTKAWKFDQIFNEIEKTPFLKNRIIITGFVPDEDLAAIYSDALFFVYPSFYEGFGLPPLEAMKCGTPVITSNTSSLPEVVGDAGIMVSPTDIDGLCEAMLSVYNNPSLREEMAIKSLKCTDRFSWEQCGSKTIEAYRASLND